MNNEFQHYQGCKRDPENCSGCALTTEVMIDYGPNDRRKGINYAAWPLSYLANNRQIPNKFLLYLLEELKSDNKAYVDNLVAQLKKANEGTIS